MKATLVKKNYFSGILQEASIEQENIPSVILALL